MRNRSSMTATIRSSISPWTAVPSRKINDERRIELENLDVSKCLAESDEVVNARLPDRYAVFIGAHFGIQVKADIEPHRTQGGAEAETQARAVGKVAQRKVLGTLKDIACVVKSR